MKSRLRILLVAILVISTASCSASQERKSVAEWDAFYAIDLSELDFWGNSTYPKGGKTTRESLVKYWDDAINYFNEVEGLVEANRSRVLESENLVIDNALKILKNYSENELVKEANDSKRFLDCPTQYSDSAAKLIEECDRALGIVFDVWEESALCVLVSTASTLDALESFEFDKFSYVSSLPGKYGGYCGLFPGALSLQGFPRTIPTIYVPDSFSEMFDTPWVVEIAPGLWSSKVDGVGTIGAVLNSSWYGNCAAWDQWRDILNGSGLGPISGGCK